MLLLTITIFTFCGKILACPAKEAIAPCDCKTFLQTDILTCTGLLNPDELVKPITAVADKRSDIESLAIVNSSLLYIPNSIFKYTKFKQIHFINSEVMSLSDNDLAFEGLEKSLKEIRAKQAHYTANWDWKMIRNLKALELIDINNIELGSISIPFPELPKLKFLGIINAEISFIIQYAFADLKHLSVLNMKGNDISELNRNMFPEPAYNLISLDFSQNELSYLPGDIFRNMPSLSEVILDNNKFTTLDRKVFEWAIKNLSELAMRGNKFECDCRMRWMAGARGPIVFTGECASPKSLAGRPLRQLNLEEMKC